MKNILQVNTSILGEHSVSKLLSDYAANKLSQQHGAVITVRDTLEIPQLTSEALAAFSGASEALDPKGKALLDLSNKMIEEIQSSDVIILGVPMYNFAISSQLKSYFDFISRAGVSFKYTENGPIGLLSDKRVYAINASGGIYQSPQDDLITPYVRKILAFLGINDVHFVYAEGLAMNRGADKDKIVAQAKRHLDEIMAVEDVAA